MMTAMQGEVSREDIIFGSIVLTIFVAFCILLGYAITKFKNWRFSRHWEPLMPLITNPKITEDGAAAATSWLSGIYRGAAVYASMSPNVGKYSGDSGGNANNFSVGVRNVAGRNDWTVEWKTGLPLIRKAGWAVHSKDKALQSLLEGSSIVALISPLGEADLRYSVRDRTLVWMTDIEPHVVLPPDQFRRTLDVLLEVASISNSLNA
jgi:hypothetical protein